MTEPAVRVVLVSGPDSETLESIGRSLVDERLAACVNIIPGMTSVYRWQGETKADPEALAIIKTTRDRIPAVQLRVADLHPYDVPELVSLEVAEGSPAYLRWVTESVTEGRGDVEA